MIFSQFQREDQDAVYTVVYNVSGGAFVAGGCCVWDTSASVDGLRVTTAAAGTLTLVRGIVVEAIANSAYGKALVHGYYDGAGVRNGVTTIAVGAALLAVASTDDFTFGATGGAGHAAAFVYAAEGIAYVTQTTLSSTQTGIKVLVRAL